MNEPEMLEKVCVFLDGNNFYFALKNNNHNTRVDYYELSKALVGPDRQLIRTYYYLSVYDPVAAPEQAQTQQPFLEALARAPYLELRSGRFSNFKSGTPIERGLDARMAGEMVYFAGRELMDTAIVLTSNIDFGPVIEKVKDLGCHVEVGMFSNGENRELRKAADIVIPLDDVLKRFGRKIFPGAIELDDNRGNKLVETPKGKINGDRESVLETTSFFEKVMRKTGKGH